MEDRARQEAHARRVPEAPSASSWSTSVPVMSAGKQIGRELHAPERELERLGERRHEERLGEPGHAHEERVPARQERHEHAGRRRASCPTTRTAMASCSLRLASAAFSRSSASLGAGSERPASVGVKACRTRPRRCQRDEALLGHAARRLVSRRRAPLAREPARGAAALPPRVMSPTMRIKWWSGPIRAWRAAGGRRRPGCSGPSPGRGRSRSPGACASGSPSHVQRAAR